MSDRRSWSDRRWNIAGIAAVLISAVALAGAIGIGFTRADESQAVAPVPPLVAQVPKKIVVVGDSYTQGTVQGGSGDSSWAALSFRQLRREGLDLQSGIAARGNSGYVARGLGDLTIGNDVKRIVEKDDDAVVIFGGLNDQHEPLDVVGKAVADTLSSVKETAPNAKVVVIGPAWPAWSIKPPTPDILALRDAIRDEATKVDATFVDPINDQWFAADPALIGEDGIHPTGEGHVYMSERLLPYLRSALTPQGAANG